MTISDKTPAAGLYIVATPIGNARDITLRALDILAGATHVYCEDTRVTRKLLTLHGLTRSLAAYHEHNAEKALPQILQQLADGASVALVSDAGTPLISDPGYRLVQASREQGHEIFAVPGASSPVAALSISGFPSDRFFFAGFLPPKKAMRQRQLEELAAIRATLILFESAKRLAALLADIDTVLPDRPIAICRELTKAYEEVRQGSAAELAAYYTENGAPKGEIVVLVHPPADIEKMPEAEVRQMLDVALREHHTRAAADLVAAASGWPRRAVYQMALGKYKPEDTK